VNEEERHSLLLKAGTLYEQRNELENAVKYFLSKGISPCRAIIEQLGTDLLRAGRKSDLVQWLQPFRRDGSGESLASFLLTMTRGLWREGRMCLSLKGLHRFQQKGDTKGALLSLARFIEVQFSREHTWLPLKG